MEKKTTVICEEKMYVDLATGLRVTQLKQVLPRKGDIKYVGHKTLNGTQGKVPFAFPFPDGTTLARAFASFDEVGKEAFDDMQRQSQIVPATSMPKKPIIFKGK